MDQAIVLFTGGINRNDFFLLHGITASWALKQVIPHLDCNDQLLSIRTLLASLLGVYAIQGCPDVNIEAAEISHTASLTWESLRQIGTSPTCEGLADSLDPDINSSSFMSMALVHSLKS